MHLTKTLLFWQDPDMTIRVALTLAHKQLIASPSLAEQAWLEVELLLAYILEKDRAWLTAHDDEALSTLHEQRFFQLINRRSHLEPFAYLIGSKEFCGLPFLVNKHVLIPRPETEEILELIQPKETSLVWDVGTGSGAIAVAVKHKFPHLHVIASDVSKRALQVAEKNAQRLLPLHAQLKFFQASLLTKEISTYIADKSPDNLIVLANLPYLPQTDKQSLTKDVVAYEPHLALFTEEDGNALIIKLLKQLKLFLQKQSIAYQLIFEFDPPQAATLLAIASSLFPLANTIIKKDACGRERFLEIHS